ncbi:NUDIX domain-containing protein [Alicyclobacillus fastidiosus]|uniref:NUDIX domain-containing protein n=1 Tax=Alicyclobacillus fastidiosus TaxID=392011 RepID=UPI0034D5CE77
MPVTLGVKVVFLYKDEVLLVKHSYQDQWGIPGGRIEDGEHLVHVSKREIVAIFSIGRVALKLRFISVGKLTCSSPTQNFRFRRTRDCIINF